MTNLNSETFIHHQTERNTVLWKNHQPVGWRGYGVTVVSVYMKEVRCGFVIRGDMHVFPEKWMLIDKIQQILWTVKMSLELQLNRKYNHYFIWTITLVTSQCDFSLLWEWDLWIVVQCITVNVKSLITCIYLKKTLESFSSIYCS